MSDAEEPLPPPHMVPRYLLFVGTEGDNIFAKDYIGWDSFVAGDDDIDELFLACNKAPDGAQWQIVDLGYMRIIARSSDAKRVKH